jgi:hypothetical protein
VKSGKGIGNNQELGDVNSDINIFKEVFYAGKY